MSYEIRYMDRRGAGCVQRFSTADELLRVVRKLKAVATIYRDGAEIGRIWRASGEVDDKRVKWLWAFDHDGV